LLAAAGAPPAALAGAKLVDCTFPPPGAQWLPEACLHGPIQYTALTCISDGSR